MILWDAVDMMQRHIPDGSIDVALVAVPFFLRVPPDQRATDYYLELNGEKPRFRADWDSFASIEQYETFCSEWIDEVMRRLHKTSPATSRYVDRDVANRRTRSAIRRCPIRETPPCRGSNQVRREPAPRLARSVARCVDIRLNAVMKAPAPKARRSRCSARP